MSVGSRQERPDLAAVAAAVWSRCVEDGFRGIDPYDGLKSRVLAPLLPHSRWLRLAVIQGVKRCPVNLRPLLRIEPGLNPKGLALLLLAGADRPQLIAATDRDRLADLMIGLASRPDGGAVFFGRRLDRPAAEAFAAAAPEAAGWGYDFPWQARAFHQPPYYPTVVCTSFVVDALAATGHPAAGAVTRAAACFVRRHLHRHADKTGSCYSYSPHDRARVWNASLFAGKILARAALAAEGIEARQLRDEAVETVRYVLARQRDDGAWVYGEASHWQWVDNLHTGYVLETVAAIARLLGEPLRWAEPLAAGLAYYRRHLFAPDGTPYYFADRPHHLDSHTVATSALTLLAFADRDADLADQARRVLEIGVEQLYDPRRRGFMYLQGRVSRHRTIYLRWSQAWMLQALAACLAHEERTA